MLNDLYGSELMLKIRLENFYASSFPNCCSSGNTLGMYKALSLACTFTFSLPCSSRFMKGKAYNMKQNEMYTEKATKILCLIEYIEVSPLQV